MENFIRVLFLVAVLQADVVCGRVFGFILGHHVFVPLNQMVFVTLSVLFIVGVSAFALATMLFDLLAQ